MTQANRASLGIALVIAGMVCISINDMLIKRLSGGYPLHELVFVRSAIAIVFSLFFVQMEGGWRILKTQHPVLHALRGLLLVIANMTFFVALAVLPLADVTALFFVAPLFITVLSIPLLGEKVGPVRWAAVLIGFVGVVIMQRPWESAESLGAARIFLVMPVIAALTYALVQIMTRKLGSESQASAMALYTQVMFVVVSVAFFGVAGDGRYAMGAENPSLIFLFRAWVWPPVEDMWPLALLGLNAAAVGYCLSQAYRVADAAAIAPFEYVGLPLAVLWGYVIFGDLPVWEVWVGMALILSAGVFVFLRERQKLRSVERRLVRGRSG